MGRWVDWWASVSGCGGGGGGCAWPWAGVSGCGWVLIGRLVGVGGWVGCELLSLHAGVSQCQCVCLVLNSSFVVLF